MLVFIPKFPFNIYLALFKAFKTRFENLVKLETCRDQLTLTLTNTFAIRKPILHRLCL